MKTSDSSTLLTRRVEKILPSGKSLKQLLTKKKIRLYQGFDPTSPTLHLGHTIGLRKLMEFARAGHEVIFLFGTGTVLAGDPSERNTGRKLITQEEINENIKTWKKQAEKIIDFDLIKIKQNGDWLTHLTLKDIIKIGSNISATQLFKRESFTRRIKAGDPVWFHETMYPLLQGYDSVVMDVDLEIGGTDQEFNMLIGRELQKKMNHREKFVITTPLINGTDGRKMSKSVGNCIWLTDTPQDVYGKLMSLHDKMVPTYFELLTDIPIEEINAFNPNKPVENKKRLAFEITRQLHGQSKAQKAQNYFERVIQGGQAPQNAPKIKVKSGPQTILALLKSTQLGISSAQLKRTIIQGGVELNGAKLTDPNRQVAIKGGELLKFGKHRYQQLIT